MKDNKILLVNILIYAIFMFIFMVDMWEINELNSANEKLKKEKYECKQELKKYKDEYLIRIVKGE